MKEPTEQELTVRAARDRLSALMSINLEPDDYRLVLRDLDTLYEAALGSRIDDRRDGGPEDLFDVLFEHRDELRKILGTEPLKPRTSVPRNDAGNGTAT